MRWDNVCPTFKCRFFQPGWDKQTWWDNFCSRLLNVELSRWFKSFSCWWKFWTKLLFQNPIFTFNSNLLLLFINLTTLWNQKHQSFQIFFIRQTATQNFSCNLLLLSWPASLLKISLFNRCFSNIFLVKTSDLVYP